MQSFQFVFNKKIYTTKSGLISAQNAWYNKKGFALLLTDLLNGIRNPLRVLEERANGPFQPCIREQILADIAEIKEVFMIDIIQKMSHFNSRQWTTKPEIGAKVGRSEAIKIIMECPVFFTDEEINRFIERAKTEGAEKAKARYHAKVASRAAAPAAAPKKQGHKRVRRNRAADKAPANAKGKKK